MSINKILLRTRVFGKLSQNFSSKESFINFNKEYCLNLKKLNIKINNVNIYEDNFKNTLYSEVIIDDNFDINQIKKEDLFYLLKYKYHKENLELKVNYLEKDLSISTSDLLVDNYNIFLL